MNIEKFQIIDIDGVGSGDPLYETLDEARKNAIGDQAVEMLTFEFTDSELVWTPNDGDTWPPERDASDD